MEKILVVLDAKKQDTSSIEFACFLAGLTHSSLTGFVVNGEAEVVGASSSMANNSKQQNLDFFSNHCFNHGLHYHISYSTDDYLTELIKESRFADLIVVDASTSVNSRAEGNLSPFVKEILRSSECPVIIAPFEFSGIDDIILAYDNSSSAVFAFKQFTYLFPVLTSKKLTVVEVIKNTHDNIEERNKLIDLIKQHYASTGYQLLKGVPEKELFSVLSDRKNSFLIMGSFGRNRLSLLVEPSTSELIVKCINLPIFIAHR